MDVIVKSVEMVDVAAGAESWLALSASFNPGVLNLFCLWRPWDLN